MSSSIDINDFDISNLPSDIVRTIIGVGVESVDEMRLISHRWNTLTLEHLSHREKLPVIKNIWFPTGYDGFMENPRVRVDNRYRNYFGLHNWRTASSALDNEFDINQDRLANNPEKMVWFANRLARLVQRCSSVERLQLTGLQCGNIDLNFVKNVLGDVNVREFDIRYHSKSTSSIIEALRLFPSARRLTLSFDYDQFEYAQEDAKFPIFLRKIVEKIEIVELTLTKLFAMRVGATLQAVQALVEQTVNTFSQNTGINIRLNSIDCDNDRRVTVHLKATKMEQ